MLARTTWAVVLLASARCQGGLDSALLSDIFGEPPKETTTEKRGEGDLYREHFGEKHSTDAPAIGKLDKDDLLIDIFGMPNTTDTPGIGKLDKDDLLIDIFGMPNTTDTPGIGKLDKDDLLIDIFGMPNTTDTPGIVSSSDAPAPTSAAYMPCELRDKAKGICVPYYLCDVCSELVITDGNGILDIRNTRSCPEALLVCCLEANTLTEANNTGLDSLSPDLNATVVVDSSTGSTQRPKKVVPSAALCGVAHHQGLAVRINGMEPGTVFGEFPWMVGILSEESADWDASSYVGGGSLLGPRAVLTGAHPVLGRLQDEVALRVRAGEWDTKSVNEKLLHVEAAVLEAIVHDDFNSGSLHNNIALLILKTPIERQPHIGYACLPAPGALPPAPPAPPAVCYSMGWGSESEQTQFAVFLKKIKMPIVPPGPCQTDLRTTYLTARFLLHHSFVCAGGKKGEDTCQGDGGSPLVCAIPGEKHRYTQVGIVAFGVGCGEGHPGLYTNVATFRTWLDNNMRQRKLDTTSYSY